MIEIRYAERDEDIVAIHQFLCVVAGPTLPGPLSPKDSVEEIWRVAHDEVAVMAMFKGVIVGTMGLTLMNEWWNHEVKFWGNRWLFALPGSEAWRPMLKEAREIAQGSGMECRIASEGRGKILIINRSKQRGVFDVLRKQPTDKHADHHAPGVAD